MTARAGACRQLALLAAVQVLVLATWFSASAVVPALRAEWGISQRTATWLTASVQLGFVAGALASAALNLPDRVAAHRLVAACSFAAAAATAGVAALADSLAGALPLRFVTGVALAGVYPPGLKLMASWFDRGRGFALGVVVGALTLGSSLPQLIAGSADLPWRAVLYTAAGLAVVGGLLAAATVRQGPLGAPAPPFRPRYALVLFRERAPRLVNLGYLGHMWELYAMWTWLPAFLAASHAAHGGDAPPVGVVAFVTTGVAGAAGCVLAGRLGDRAGRARFAAGAEIVSATCCVLAAVLFGTHPLVMLPLLVVWGAAVVADSALFSTCTTVVVDRRYVGTALTAQLALGFLLTVATIQAVPLVVDAWGWRPAVAALAVGPACGAVAMLRVRPLVDIRPQPGQGLPPGRPTGGGA